MAKSHTFNYDAGRVDPKTAGSCRRRGQGSTFLKIPPPDPLFPGPEGRKKKQPICLSQRGEIPWENKIFIAKYIPEHCVMKAILLESEKQIR